MNASHESALLLLEKAKGDAIVLSRLIDGETVPVWTIGFHAQQAVEKAIKSVLTDRAIIYPRTHNVAMLLELIRQNEIPQPPDAGELPTLTPYGSVFRYEDEIDGATIVFDRAELANWVTSTIAWASNLLLVVKSE
ncbi:HEPN domain-containing protein [bacterium]|nr:HEPN domain-containing protein [bacterium]